MSRSMTLFLSALLLAGAAGTATAQSASFQAGKHYTVLPQTQRVIL